VKEINDIIRAYDASRVQGIRSALATVVHVDGSSYRRPGARMLVTEEGELTGAISGGCLEGNALYKAMQVMISGKTTLVTYDTTDEDDARAGFSLGCSGVIQVLIEPVNADDTNNPINLLKNITLKRADAVLVTVFNLTDKKDPDAGTHLFVRGGTEVTGSSPVCEDLLIKDAEKVLEERQSAFKNYVTAGINITAFIEIIQPVISLVIFGAGNDVQPLARMASILGWNVTMIHGKQFGTGNLQIDGSCKVVLSKAGNALDHVDLDNRTVFVLMTHNYNYDYQVMRELLQKDVAYIGVLGPAKKVARMTEELKNEGMTVTELNQTRIHAPVGLDIGAETPEEIALSVLSEIKAVLAGRKGGSLKDHTDTIHSRAATRINQVHLFPQ
jgi:xanthine dehydrogenase accessory factor